MSDNAPEPLAVTKRTLGSDLGVRAASAVVLIVIALAATWIGGWTFVALVAAGGVILCSEWATMTRGERADLTFWLSIVALLLTVIAFVTSPDWFAGLPAWLIIGILGAIGLLLLNMRNDTNAHLASLGFDYVALPVIAILWFRADPVYGLAATLFLFAVVWGTDVMAYVFGRYIGGPKVWPAVSPKKTWSGAVGGMAGAVIGGLLVVILAVPDAGLTRIAFIALLLSIVSQVGDFVESGLKRRFDVKDSGALIPGHGGLFDRVDGLLFAAVAAAVYAVLFGSWDTPGMTLLLGPPS